MLLSNAANRVEVKSFSVENFSGTSQTSCRISE